MKLPLDGDLPPREVFFISDSTGITAETLGSALLANLPGAAFHRRTVSFVNTAERADAVVASITRASTDGATPLVFATVKTGPVWARISSVPAMVIDLLGGHLADLEKELGVAASAQLGQYHGVGDAHRYFARMQAVEYAIEHDDGQSSRALDRADVIIVAPSRCGKTPATMYLALQYGRRRTPDAGPLRRRPVQSEVGRADRRNPSRHWTVRVATDEPEAGRPGIAQRSA